MASPRGDQMNVLGPSMLMRDKTNSIVKSEAGSDGVASDQEDELTLDLSDRELIKIAEKWEGDYRSYAGRITKRQEENKKYYLGRQNQQSAAMLEAPVPDNILFEATEVFLAQALARNPDPVVYSDNTDAGTQESRNVRTMLVFLADALVLRQKMKMMVRHWGVYFIGVLKHGWDSHIHEITTEVRNPRHFIFDPNGHVDAYGDFVGYIGEKITAPASVLTEMFPEHEQYIGEMVEYALGTSLTWTEWWTDEYTFTTLKGRVLDKSLNPHFNYPRNMPDARGDQVIETLREGNNHFARPKKPYTFLSVFSFQEQPHDETTLIEQNRANQDYIVERSRQIARNLRLSNNSIVFSEAAGYTQQTATQALEAMENGTGALSPIMPSQAVERFEAPGVPDAFFKDLENRILSLRSIYGTLGNTAVQQDEQTTARGMILNQQRSSDRIGGTIGDGLNQVASNVFNHWVQLMHVYYDTQHTAAVLGKLRAVEEASLVAEGFTRRLIVAAAPDSMKPKDSVTEANQALALYEAGLPLDPETVLQLMDTPDIEKTVEGGILWQVNKQAYIQQNFPQLAQLLGMGMPAPAGAPVAPAPAAAGQPGPNVEQPAPPPELSAPPNSADLSQVPLSTPALPQ